MRGNSHVQFLMGKAAETPLTYITTGRKFDNIDNIDEKLAIISII